MLSFLSASAPLTEKKEQKKKKEKEVESVAFAKLLTSVPPPPPPPAVGAHGLSCGVAAGEEEEEEEGFFVLHMYRERARLHTREGGGRGSGRRSSGKHCSSWAVPSSLCFATALVPYKIKLLTALLSTMASKDIASDFKSKTLFSE